jgi:hypothetical protein
MKRVTNLASLLAFVILAGCAPVSASAQAISRDAAARAAVHPVADNAALESWLARVPITRDFPPDLAATLRGASRVVVVEMTTARGCIPCDHLWSQIATLGRRYGWQIRTISGQDALLRSGRLGLPWIGHPVAWVRPTDDSNRTIPVAIGTDHQANLLRNLYLAAKMLTGVRPAVAVRALSKFTGIVAATSHTSHRR